MKNISRFLAASAFTAFLCVFLQAPASAYDSAEAFMSVTFGLSSARTQKRMEQNGAAANDFIRNGQLVMKGMFEYRPAVFSFGFHAKRGLNYKAVYIGSTGNAADDRAFYDAMREAYSISFGSTRERPAQDLRNKGRITFQNIWKPNKDTTVSLSYNPQSAKRFPGESTVDHPIHLIYTYTKWAK